MKWKALSAMFAVFLAACGTAQPSGDTKAARVPFSGMPNGVAVRASDGAVFVTDDKTNGIVMSANIGAASPDFSLYARIPAREGERTGLSEIAFAPDGHILAERFGFGAASAVFDVAPSGQVTLAADTNPARRRLGLVVLDSGTFLSSWFVKEGDAPPAGGVSVITRGAQPGRVTERDIVTGLQKPVGMAVVGDTLFVSDQAANRIYKFDLQDARAASAPVQASDVFAAIDSPDLLAASPDGTLYTKCGAHSVCRVSRRGRASVIADGFDAPRGVAVDSARKRLIAVDRASTRETPSSLRVLPLP
ncbi:hypothetical protein [Caballeronia sp. Lep1P3]|uniref:hypothetical protein n=1 Tax=Caballeronia sp. Lep1P3 TaxID=2878150 RepID=UPI001FD4FD63|nr:hypothetical protein [Caballeronia sp. Lep1P3]